MREKTRPLLPYFQTLTEQAIVDLFAKVAKPRLMDLLKLKIRHVFETTPGDANSEILVDGCEVRFKSIKTAQPSRDLERFHRESGAINDCQSHFDEVRGRKMLKMATVAWPLNWITPELES
jgi:hypothetical protein